MAPSTSEFVTILIVLAIPFLYEMSSVFRYHFKFIVYYAYVTTISIMILPIMALRPKDVQNAIMASKICRFISPLLGIDWKLRGEEYFGRGGPCVIVANHQSSLDILGMFEFWHVMGKCTVVAKKELFYAWPFGLAAWLCGLTFVDRVKSDEAREVMNSSVQLIKAEKVKMWVFPEGTRKNTGELHPFKKGAFHVAVAAQIPIQPVVFSPFYFLDNQEKSFNQGKVIITALPPIPTEGLLPEDVNALVERVQEIMTQEFNRVSEEVYNSIPVTVSFKRTNGSLIHKYDSDKKNQMDIEPVTDKKSATSSSFSNKFSVTGRTSISDKKIVSSKKDGMNNKTICGKKELAEVIVKEVTDRRLCHSVKNVFVMRSHSAKKEGTLSEVVSTKKGITDSKIVFDKEGVSVSESDKEVMDSKSTLHKKQEGTHSI